jgi:hypothetical protein
MTMTDEERREVSSVDLHRCCERCWVERNPGRWPIRVTDPTHAVLQAPYCCWCGLPTWCGIYVETREVPPVCQHGYAVQMTLEDDDEGDGT